MNQPLFSPEFIEARRLALIEQRIERRQILEHLNDTVEDKGDLADRTDAEISRREKAEIHRRVMTDLAEIDAALTKIQRGSYGIDELTGKPISLERLEAIPTARYDVNVQHKKEKIIQKSSFASRRMEDVYEDS